MHTASTTMSIQNEDTSQIIQNIHPMVTRAKSGISKPKIYYISAFEIEPTNLKEALSNLIWYDAMKLEYNALVLNNTWTLTDPLLCATIVGCEWVFRNKYNVDGSLQRHKARVVAKAFDQQPGFDFNETFSSVIKPTTVRVILSHAITSGWFIYQIDNNNAFLHGHLEENVFMQQPPGFVSFNPAQVYKLNKAIYGLKQVPRSWFQKLSSTIDNMGFSATKSDPSLFTKIKNDIIVLILIYVDDIIIIGSSSAAIASIISSLNKIFCFK